MAKSGTGGFSLNLDVHELALDDFSINGDWSEVAKFVVYFSFTVFSAKEVNAFKNSIALNYFIIQVLDLLFLSLFHVWNYYSPLYPPQKPFRPE